MEYSNRRPVARPRRVPRPHVQPLVEPIPSAGVPHATLGHIELGRDRWTSPRRRRGEPYIVRSRRGPHTGRSNPPGGAVGSPARGSHRRRWRAIDSILPSPLPRPPDPYPRPARRDECRLPDSAGRSRPILPHAEWDSDVARAPPPTIGIGGRWTGLGSTDTASCVTYSPSKPIGSPRHTPSRMSSASSYCRWRARGSHARPHGSSSEGRAGPVPSITRQSDSRSKVANFRANCQGCSPGGRGDPTHDAELTRPFGDRRHRLPRVRNPASVTGAIRLVRLVKRGK